MKKFKTNINCSGCVAKATDTLNQIAGQENWTVDTTNPNKVLSIAKSEVKSEEVLKAIQGIGFKIEELNPPMG